VSIPAIPSDPILVSVFMVCPLVRAVALDLLSRETLPSGGETPVRRG
jgi:hypothetical protein